MKKRSSLEKSAKVWSFLVVLGVIAYGLGLYQGSNQRMKRSIASVHVILATPEPQAQTETK